ncbi:MAG: hypothetical protein KUA43_17975 [Hoeflea sp.]|uniref:hypothetical protein n=1 Tax=Hoeflea sp. TaxID=1940281 RepID=UPI001D532ACC|nr:hypothetical protein [Hoeflea sp.]MBU4529165.1 hypothetical protein [Alphaproteobacteria bacterium]MBU4543570.1 hypothetical protein [Alphaproteobacteria bacterium]MBU4549195.1 hypothetical protein [Alphaproteobacteria bacterium]MBV1725330.1 hypothetical protein [Hoeflea sp.]MBV1785291.1 hypothetical protein [Hoeflea sp.]
MKWLWLGWLVCVITAALLGYMVLVEAPAVSAMLGGMALPDAVPLGYGEEAARSLYAAFQADFTLAAAEGRQSASAAYVAMHARSDLVFPPLLAASLAFLAFASVYAGRTQASPSRQVSVGVGLVMALAFTYLACDFLENAVADAMYGPQAMAAGFNGPIVFVLQVLTRGKYLTLVLAGLIIVALWVARWKGPRQPAAPET